MSPNEQPYNLEGESSSNIDSSITQKNSLTKPLQIFKVAEDSNLQVLSLSFYKIFLIVGTNKGSVIGFNWYKNRLTKKAWEVVVSKNAIDQNDINDFWLNERDGILYAGCGDKNIYSINLDDGKLIRSFSGHTDYVHSIDGTTDNGLYSASEDGTIKFWDNRNKRSVNQLEPYKDPQLERPMLGKWQGTVSVTNDWLICGGGPLPCLYHLRSLECSSVFKYLNAVHVSGFLDDIVYIGGENRLLNQYNLKGELIAEIEMSSSAIFSVVHPPYISQSAAEKFTLSVAGSGNYLDICTNLNYKDVLLKLYEAPKRFGGSKKL